ncbi:MAG TPA: cupin, partial [Paracoccaceae bacterium]|nr:cupin [Paracoccaceae bacterium]
THEALAIAHGQAVMLLGGEGGREVGLQAGDLIVLPAGTLHRRLSASENFTACGAYPPDAKADLLRPETGHDQDRVRATVPLPDFDPFYGEHGPVTRIWSKGRRPHLH